MSLDSETNPIIEMQQALEALVNGYANNPSKDIDSHGEALFRLGEVERRFGQDDGFSTRQVALGRLAFDSVSSVKYAPEDITQDSQLPKKRYPFHDYLDEQQTFALIREFPSPIDLSQGVEIKRERVKKLNPEVPLKNGDNNDFNKQLLQGEVDISRVANQPNLPARQKNRDLKSGRLTSKDIAFGLTAVAGGLAVLGLAVNNFIISPIKDRFEQISNPSGYAQKIKEEHEVYEDKHALNTAWSQPTNTSWSISYPSDDDSKEFLPIFDKTTRIVAFEDEQLRLTDYFKGIKNTYGSDIKISGYEDTEGRIIPRLHLGETLRLVPLGFIKKEYLLNGDVKGKPGSLMRRRPDIVEFFHQSLGRSLFASIRLEESAPKFKKYNIIPLVRVSASRPNDEK